MRECIEKWEKDVKEGLLTTNSSGVSIIPDNPRPCSELQCYRCGRTFKSERSLTAHKDRMTKLSDINARIDRGEAIYPIFIYSCTYCNKRFYLFSQYMAHMRYEKRKRT